MADSQETKHVRVNMEKLTSKRDSTSPAPGPQSKSPRNVTESTSSSTEIPDGGQGDTITREMRSEHSEGLGDGPPLSPCARRKSWRRATIGRRSLPALPNPSWNLCRNIDPSLPQQERLDQLMEASMRLAVQRTQNLLRSTPNASLESFKKQVEHMQKEWSCVAKTIRSQPQCQEKVPASTASDPAVLRAMERTRKAIQSLQVESASWETLLNKHRSKAESLARKVEEGQERGVTLDPTCLVHSSQSKFIRDKPDYRNLLSRQQTILHTMELVMDVQCRMVRQLLSIQEQSSLLVKETSSRLAADAGFQDLSSDPIRNLVAVPLSSTS